MALRHDSTRRRGGRAAWFAALALSYGAFLYWYGGAGTPLSESEGRAFLERARASVSAAQHPERLRNLEALIAHDDGRQFFMTNLESLKADPEAEKEDLAYARVVIPALLRHGCFPVYIGQVRGMVLGTDDVGLSRVAIVRYRSLRDFLEIFTDPAMNAGVAHKFASLTHTEAIATVPVVTLLSVRLTVGLAVLLFACLGWMRLGRAARR